MNVQHHLACMGWHVALVTDLTQVDATCGRYELVTHDSELNTCDRTGEIGYFRLTPLPQAHKRSSFNDDFVRELATMLSKHVTGKRKGTVGTMVGFLQLAHHPGSTLYEVAVH